MSLQNYKAKRNFKKSPEPPPAKAKSGHIYCIQKHDASHLHYDLRLQLGGVLKSWAVPKGPSLDPKKKRLAIEVEDHPVNYATFEGVIPEGYGAGEVVLWDYGTWKPLQSPQEALKKGHLDFEIQGERLKGRWTLVRTRKVSNKNQWLLIKQRDEMAQSASDQEITDMHSSSVLQQPHFIPPQLAQLATTPPRGEKWIHEIKFDGYRTLGHIRNGVVHLYTRKGLDWSEKYPSIRQALTKLKVKETLIDGEIVCLDSQGRSDFQLLQEALKSSKCPMAYYLFDLLSLNGKDLRDIPLEERKKKLKKILGANNAPPILYSEHWDRDGGSVLKEACRLGLEGIVSKDRTRSYLSGRTSAWIKTKCNKGQEFIVIGYTQGKGSRNGFGSLLIAAYDSAAQLQYCGHVGTGFDSATLKDISHRLKKSKSPPLSMSASNSRGVQWVKPNLVIEVQFQGWTKEGVLRHPTFKGIRLDKPASEVTIEKQQDTPDITNPQKVLIPELGTTKEDVLHYYEAVAEFMLPHVQERPLSLLRCPDGIHAQCFFQKNIKSKSYPGIKEFSFKDEMGKTKSFSYIRDKEGLLSLCQMAAIEIHVWGSHKKHFMKPDLIVFDLDPGEGVSWVSLVDAALELRKILTSLKLKSYVKLSGGKGLHVHVPILPEYDWDEVKAYAKGIAQHMAKAFPEKYTDSVSKRRRQNRIFIDYLRNGFGATSVAPFSLRARSEGGAAIPVDWKSLKKINPAFYTIKNSLEYLKKRRSDPWSDYFSIKQSLGI